MVWGVCIVVSEEKDSVKKSWDEEDADENDIKESWEDDDDEPAVVCV